MSEPSPVVEKLSGLTMGQALIGGVVIALIYYMMFYDDGVRLENQIKSTKTEIQTKQVELKKFKKAEEDAKKYKEALEQEGPKFEAIVKYMPTELSEFEVMEVLSTEVKAAGGRVKSTNAKALPQNDKDLYHTIGVDLTLEITYSQLLLFLSYLTKTDKIITLKQVTMSKRDKEIEGESLLSFSGQFEAYKYNPKSTSEASNAQ